MSKGGALGGVNGGGAGGAGSLMTPLTVRGLPAATPISTLLPVGPGLPICEGPAHSLLPERLVRAPRTPNGAVLAEATPVPLRINGSLRTIKPPLLGPPAGACSCRVPDVATAWLTTVPWALV